MKNIKTLWAVVISVATLANLVLTATVLFEIGHRGDPKGKPAAATASLHGKIDYMDSGIGFVLRDMVEKDDMRKIEGDLSNIENRLYEIEKEMINLR